MNIVGIHRLGLLGIELFVVLPEPDPTQVRAGQSASQPASPFRSQLLLLMVFRDGLL